MKENQNIDELLNGFIDGELTQRQQTEVQRLLSHDPQVAERLRELERCKMLVGSLPRAEAPPGMVEQIKASLAGRTLLSEQPQRIDQRRGARQLLARRVLAAAAMIGLIAVLGAVVYTIVAPQPAADKPLAVEQWKQPTRKVELESPEPTVVATAEKPTAEVGPTETGFTGRLELKTAAVTAVDAFINRAIEENGFLEKAGPEAQAHRHTYALSCSREALSLLLSDLQSIWGRFESATLFVETDPVAEPVVVASVGAEQIAEIANQGSLPGRIKLAKDFAVLNNMAELVPGKGVLAAIDSKTESLITIPKPVLTSAEKTIKALPDPAERGTQVHLTIVVVDSHNGL